MTLYLKYRPQTFSDVVGQDHIVTTLENAVEQDQISHAYLFSGTRGTGKTSIARILAKIILARGVKDEVMQKQIIKGVEDGSLVDLIEIDAASTRGIDDIRELIEKIQFAPVAAGAKVYIIDEVHMLTKEAFNALLKTLEEPPDYAYFILATTEAHKIPETIHSRCQRFPFRRVRDEDIIRRIQYIADQERINVERGAVRIIARNASGSFRDAISLLDQLRSLPTITEKDVKERTGDTGEQYINDIFDVLEQKDIQRIPELIGRIEDDGIPTDKIMRHLLGILRERMHEAIEKKQDTAVYMTMLNALLLGLKDLRIAPIPGLVLEATLVSLCQGTTEKAAAPKEVFAKIETIEKKPTEEVTAKTDPVPAKPEKTGIVEAMDLTMENAVKAWSEVMQQVTQSSVKMSMKNGRPTNVDKDKIFVSFASAFHRDKVAGTEASRNVEQIMEKIFKRSIRLECVVEEGAHERSQEEGETTNLAEAAAEVFGA